MKSPSILYAGVVCSVLTSTVLASHLTCQPMRWIRADEGKNLDKEKIYTFKVRQECTLTSDASLAVTKMKDAFERTISSSSDYTVNSRNNVQQNSAMTGKVLAVHEERSTKHGDLAIDGKIYLLDNGVDKFKFDYITDYVEGKKNAKYTQYERLEMSVTTAATPNTYYVEFSQTNRVRKPGLAWESIFICKAKEGIEEQLEAITQKHAEILSKAKP